MSSLDFANTRICFVTAHLAAGFANYDERNRDYQTVAHGLRFLRNRTIDDHDAIIWLGDFNYRIGLSNERVRKLIEEGDLATLYQNDQVMPKVCVCGVVVANPLRVEPPNGRRSSFHILLGSQHNIPAHV